MKLKGGEDGFNLKSVLEDSCVFVSRLTLLFLVQGVIDFSRDKFDDDGEDFDDDDYDDDNIVEEVSGPNDLD